MVDNSFFNFSRSYSLAELATATDSILQNSRHDTKIIEGVAPIETANNNEITFLSNIKYLPSLVSTKAGACIVSKKTSITNLPDDFALLLNDNPYLAYAKIASLFYPENTTGNNSIGNIDTTAKISKTAIIAKNCTIKPYVIIEDGVSIGEATIIDPGTYIKKSVKIGKNCQIAHNVTLSHCIIGDNVIIHPGVRIGQDGFGFATDNGNHIKVPQLGRVIIGNNVEIGANSCIDRGSGHDTIIGDGTKIDNLVQIGHNVQTGKGCIIVAQVGIAGSSKLGNYVVLGGQVGVAGHLNIGNMVNVAAQSGIAQDVSDKAIIGGSPAVPIKQWHRQNFALKKLINPKRAENDE